MNKAYLKAGRGPESDECLTPRYAVEPIIKYLRLKGYKKIWCPFDKDDSMFVRVLEAEGFTVTHSHIGYYGDFFGFNHAYPFNYDCVVSNPPFSCKDKILEILFNMHNRSGSMPFAVILPQNSLQGVKRVGMFMEHGMEYLGFDRRINYYTRGETDAWKPANHFASGYFCHNVLPQPMIMEKLIPVQEPYYVDII